MGNRGEDADFIQRVVLFLPGQVVNANLLESVREPVFLAAGLVYLAEGPLPCPLKAPYYLAHLLFRNLGVTLQLV